MIPEPKKPEPPAYEDLSLIPDQQCVWDEEGWYADIHGGLHCTVCDEITECSWCVKGVEVDLNCLRNQAEVRNWKRKHEYKLALARYEAQMDYYREVVAGA